MILFLDFDGVLHPDAVYRERGRPVLRDQGELFMWSGRLVDVLAIAGQASFVICPDRTCHQLYARGGAMMVRNEYQIERHGRTIAAGLFASCKSYAWRRLEYLRNVGRHQATCLQDVSNARHLEGSPRLARSGSPCH